MESTLVFLTIVLSMFLAIFLLLGIILLVKSIQIASKVQHMAETSDSILHKVEEFAGFLQKTSGSLAVGKLVTKIVDHLSHKQSKDKGDK